MQDQDKAYLIIYNSCKTTQTYFEIGLVYVFLFLYIGINIDNEKTRHSIFPSYLTSGRLRIKEQLARA